MRAALFVLCWSWGASAATVELPARPPQPPPALYRLGPGDVVAVRVWGHEDSSAAVEVRPDGYVALPLAGEVWVEGMTPGELARELARRLSTYVRDPQVTVSVQQFRTLQASILGAVRAPGAYSLRFDARLPDLVGRGGGLLEEADASAAVLTRTLPDGTTRTLEVDLAAVLQGRHPAPELANGDVLYVPPARPAVVLGAVQAPGPYSVRPGMRLLDLLAAAGGLAPRADAASARLTRGGADGTAEVLTVDLARLLEDPLSPHNVPVRAGDLLVVPEARELVVLGAVRNPGAHPYTPGMRLLDALAMAGGPQLEAAGAVTVLRRGAGDGADVTLRYEAQALLRAEPSANPPMEPGDVVLVEQAVRAVAVLGEVARPGAVPYRPGLTLLDALALAGGPTERADLAEALLSRPGEAGQQQVRRLDLRALLPDAGLVAADGGAAHLHVPLQPGDVVVIPRLRRQVIVLGAVLRPGAYELQGPATLLEALALAGGVDLTRAGATVTVHRRGSSADAPAVPAGEAAGSGASRPLEIPLQRLLTRGDAASDVPVQGGDVVVVAEAPQQVAVLGEVARPGSFPLRPGMRALDAIAQAGGLLETADPSRVVLLRDGQQPLDYAAMLADAGNDRANPQLSAGDVLVVERVEARVLVLGSVTNPQALPYRPGLRVLDAIAMAGGPREEADLSQVSVTQASGDTQVVNLADPGGRPAGTGGAELRPGDVVFVPPSRTVLVLGAVNRPGSYPVPPGGRVLDALALAGGVRPEAGVSTVLVSRQPGSGAQAVYSLPYDRLLAQPLGPENLPVQGGDVVYVPSGQRQVLVLGQVRNPGVYTLPATTPVHLLDALAMAGGPTPRARLEAVGILRSGGEREQAAVGRGGRLFQGKAEENPPLRPGDIVYVPETRWPDWREIFGFVAGVNTFVELVQRLQ